VQEDVTRPALPLSEWRVAALGLWDAAADADAHAAVDGRRAAAYDGTYHGVTGRRDGGLARVVYESLDLYYGPYRDDRRAGKGIYLFANGGAYSGARSLPRPCCVPPRPRGCLHHRLSNDATRV
jgi:hypothetical protein